MKKTEFIALIKEAITKVDGIPTTAPASDEVDPELVGPVLDLIKKIDAKTAPAAGDTTAPADGTAVDVSDTL